ncbi:MAG: hypothetical protein JXB47_10960 [Anaerolineae bacterium]|nr:hypothetical protein [Anaerolineae bacterium]
MDSFVIASSMVLDRLWEDEAFWAHFDAAGYDLRAAAKLIPIVFRQAYIDFCARVPAERLAELQQEAIDQLMLQMVRSPSFIEIWPNWDEAYQEQFLEEQAEPALGVRLAALYPEPAQQAYCAAFDAYLDKHPNPNGVKRET